MKKFLKSALSILAIGALIYSCSQEEQLNLENENLNNLETLSNKITLNETTNKVSSLFLNLGISEIAVKEKDNQKIVSMTSEKEFGFNGDAVNLSNYSINVNNKLIILNEDDKFKAGIVENKAYIITPDYTGFYDDADLITRENVKTFVLIGYLNELLYTKEKLSFTEASNSLAKAGCSFWDTYYSVGVGLTPGTAQANLEFSMAEDISSGDADGCTKIGEPEAVPLTNGTVQVQGWCCP
jgi:hypothetical protein